MDGQNTQLDIQLNLVKGTISNSVSEKYKKCRVDTVKHTLKKSIWKHGKAWRAVCQTEYEGEKDGFADVMQRYD